MANFPTAKQIKSDELFVKGLDKLSPFLKQRYLNGFLIVRKNDIKKLANDKIPDGSIDDDDVLNQLID